MKNNLYRLETRYYKPNNDLLIPLFKELRRIKSLKRGTGPRLPNQGKESIWDIRRRVNRIYDGQCAEIRLKRGEHGNTFDISPNLKHISYLGKALRDFKERIRRDRYRLRSLPTTVSDNALTVDFSHWYNYTGLTHVQSGQVLKLAKRRFEQLPYLDKKPTTYDRYVGVEVEYCSPYDYNEMGTYFRDAGLAKYIKSTDDGSVYPDNSDDDDYGCTYHSDYDDCENYPDDCERENNEHGNEVCILARESEINSIIDRVCEVIATNNGYVNKTCGLHVHLDMRSRDRYKALNNMVCAQNVLFSMVPISRQKGGGWCKKVKSKRWGKRSSMDSDRYHAFNKTAYYKHKTLEVRIHSGTMSASKINHWINLLIKIADASKVKRQFKNVKDISHRLKLTSALTEYMLKRVAKFRPEHLRAEKQAKAKRLAEKRVDSGDTSNDPYARALQREIAA